MITEYFLIEKGFSAWLQYPKYNTFRHTRNKNVFCSVGKNAEFSIVELDKNYLGNYREKKAFKTFNEDLTEEDFNTIIKLAKIDLYEK